MIQSPNCRTQLTVDYVRTSLLPTTLTQQPKVNFVPDTRDATWFRRTTIREFRLLKRVDL